MPPKPVVRSLASPTISTEDHGVSVNAPPLKSATTTRGELFSTNATKPSSVLESYSNATTFPETSVNPDDDARATARLREVTSAKRSVTSCANASETNSPFVCVSVTAPAAATPPKPPSRRRAKAARRTFSPPFLSFENAVEPIAACPAFTASSVRGTRSVPSQSPSSSVSPTSTPWCGRNTARPTCGSAPSSVGAASRSAACMFPRCENLGSLGRPSGHTLTSVAYAVVMASPPVRPKLFPPAYM
mmetsp:Transcript_1260/g.5100  ORF Transcript_1260/g.5100 Transcript_1260/m.5100 type:complete len:246 (+) Transcript_1260:2085-2822(+)